MCIWASVTAYWACAAAAGVPESALARHGGVVEEDLHEDQRQQHTAAHQVDHQQLDHEPGKIQADLLDAEHVYN